MGFFSYNCKGCDHPMLSEHATNGINSWMNEVIVLDKAKGVIAKGGYDGYGRIPQVEGDDLYRVTYDEKTGDCLEACWHEACWEKAGKPGYDGSSKSAYDQGYFFDEGAHDVVDPTKYCDCNMPADHFYEDGKVACEECHKWGDHRPTAFYERSLN